MNTITEGNVVLKVDRLTKRFRENIAVDELGFEIYSGEIFGLLGPNGAGKSTVLSIISGLVRADEGSVTVFSYDLKNNFIDAAKHMGVLVEYPSFYNYLTAEDNLKILCRVKSVSTKEIYSVLQKMELTKWAKLKVKSYSVGMKKRLGIANALLGNPKFLVLDEPTSGLDPKGRQIVLDLIKSISKNEKHTFLISSNLLLDIEATCDRALLINNGKALFCEYVENLLRPLKESFTLRIEPLEEAIPILNNMRGVELVKKHNLNTLHVVVSDISSAELNKYLVGMGFNIFEICTVQRTLEELFLKL
jgi:ABC-type multidrug transport system ATPase subunit